jgi:hypothetical protein
MIHGSSANTPDPIFIDAYINTGGSGSTVTDICSRINTAWTAAVSSTVPSVVIDARGFTGTWPCAVSPFPASSSGFAGGKLLLGNVIIQTTVTWQIPPRVHVEGLGVAANTAASAINTTIQAASGLTGAVVQLGTGSNLSFDVQLKSLTVDAAGIASIGILNNSSEEGTTVEDVNIYNATEYGLALLSQSSISPGNSGPYRNMNIQFNSECGSSCSSAVGIYMSTVSSGSESFSAIRGIDNVTISGVGAGGDIATCIYDYGWPVKITNSHVEYCSTVGIQIGAAASTGTPITTQNVQIENVSTDPFVTTAYNIVLTNASDILLSGITGYSLHILDDTVTGNTITGTTGTPYYLGYYLLGDGTTPAVLTTASSVTTGWQYAGKLNITGTKDFKIDDPMDPAHKYLYHAAVESPDMMNVYNGSVTTDKHGIATVTLPDYFEALNREFRYQLTAIGSFAQATVAKKIANNRFSIQTSKPNVEVSWQVTGLRKDAYAQSHPFQVEEQKPAQQQ